MVNTATRCIRKVRMQSFHFIRGVVFMGVAQGMGYGSHYIERITASCGQCATLGQTVNKRSCLFLL